MHAVGVDGGVLASASSMYRYDASYALPSKPRTLSGVNPFDPTDPAVADTSAGRVVRL
ncbi:MAG: hypothetical protein J2P48_22210 [Alphaproteobacteria bacterium]|nr:hypothetical protein [Alphaproteobacteria bacterium]